jgi:anti-sigma factor RsiW
VLTCKDVIELLMDYLESTVTPEVAAEVDRHLERCPACVAYLNTYRKTQELTSEALSVAMPEDMKARLRGFLLDHLGRQRR